MVVLSRPLSFWLQIYGSFNCPVILMNHSLKFCDTYKISNTDIYFSTQYGTTMSYNLKFNNSCINNVILVLFGGDKICNHTVLLLSLKCPKVYMKNMFDNVAFCAESVTALKLNIRKVSSCICKILSIQLLPTTKFLGGWSSLHVLDGDVNPWYLIHLLFMCIPPTKKYY